MNKNEIKNKIDEGVNLSTKLKQLDEITRHKARLPSGDINVYVPSLGRSFLMPSAIIVKYLDDLEIEISNQLK